MKATKAPGPCPGDPLALAILSLMQSVAALGDIVLELNRKGSAPVKQAPPRALRLVK